MTNESELFEKLKTTIDAAGLSHVADKIAAAAQPAIQIELHAREESDIPVGKSKIGGSPDLPNSYRWPEWKGKPTGFIGQIDLGTVSKYDFQHLLPTEGLLSFFYDLDEQPWGYNPKELGYSRVEYFSPEIKLSRRESPGVELRLRCSGMSFSPSLTIPYFSSRAGLNLSGSEDNKYGDLAAELETVYARTDIIAYHRLLGHSQNVQGDMQLEAELVTNGLFCGNETGYRDPRAKILEPSYAQWQLLFQLDSDDSGGFTWGDAGMLYYWIRREDLASRMFEYHWMTMQCY